MEGRQSRIRQSKRAGDVRLYRSSSRGQNYNLRMDNVLEYREKGRPRRGRNYVGTGGAVIEELVSEFLRNVGTQML